MNEINLLSDEIGAQISVVAPGNVTEKPNSGFGNFSGAGSTIKRAAAAGIL